MDEELFDAVHCSGCGFTSLNLALTRCVNDNTVLGEITGTMDELFGDVS